MKPSNESAVELSSTGPLYAATRTWYSVPFSRPCICVTPGIDRFPRQITSIHSAHLSRETPMPVRKDQKPASSMEDYSWESTSCIAIICASQDPTGIFEYMLTVLWHTSHVPTSTERQDEPRFTFRTSLGYCG